MMKGGYVFEIPAFIFMGLIMRMWGIPPEYMCIKHIVAEHGEKLLTKSIIYYNVYEHSC
jgi:hypothetical protein